MSNVVLKVNPSDCKVCDNRHKCAGLYDRTPLCLLCGNAQHCANVLGETNETKCVALANGTDCYFRY